MTHSEQIDQLGAALALAQAEIKGAEKRSSNPYFKSSYADIASVWDAVRGPLTKHGLSVVQSPGVENGLVTVTTLLLHASGQWIRTVACAEVKDLTAQSVGSAVTYLRRYALSAVAGTYGDVVDDDGEAAQGRKPEEPVKPKGYDQWLAGAKLLADTEGVAALQAYFKAGSQELRKWATGTDRDQWTALKVAAQHHDDQVTA